MIVLDRLTKTFEQKDGSLFYAVDDLSFTAEDGQIVALVGVNGAGKTTTMRMLSTVLQPTSGEAFLANYSILKDPQKVRLSLGFLSGDTGLYGRLTCREILKYFGKLYDCPLASIEENIGKLAKLLTMESFLDKRIDFLSTGMKQKVSIARSIIHNPPVMIFDEPTSGLDILTARNIIDFILHCKDEGKCVLFSTHNMREAEKLADKIVMIHEGNLLAEDTLENLRNASGLWNLDDIFVSLAEKKSGEEDSEAQD